MEASSFLKGETGMLRTALNILAWLLILGGLAEALTVDEIIRLKQAGVSDSTIALLIKGEGDNRRAGTWKTKDGWIVHSTDTRDPKCYDHFDSPVSYPFAVVPRVFAGPR